VRTVYQSLPSHDVWAQLGAIEKANSVVELAGGLPRNDVLEVGCGTGAVLFELLRRGFAMRYWGCEPAPELCSYAQHKIAPGVPIQIACATLDANPFPGQRFDLIYLSHVIEHVHDPASLIIQALTLSDQVIVEVPLEGSLWPTYRKMPHSIGACTGSSSRSCTRSSATN
jgi:SAM-dependent methyltransferase